jgi:hypothetical protein
MAVPAEVTRRFAGSAAHGSAEIVRREIGGEIVRTDPPFAYGRQMVVRDDAGVETRVPFDLRLLQLQRAAMLRETWHSPVLRPARGITSDALRASLRHAAPVSYRCDECGGVWVDPNEYAHGHDCEAQ